MNPATIEKLLEMADKIERNRYDTLGIVQPSMDRLGSAENPHSGSSLPPSELSKQWGPLNSSNASSL